MGFCTFYVAFLAHGGSFQLKAHACVHQPVEDGVCRGGVSLHHVIPVRHGQLRDYDGGLLPVPVLYDLHEVKQLLPVHLECCLQALVVMAAETRKKTARLFAQKIEKYLCFSPYHLQYLS